MDFITKALFIVSDNLKRFLSKKAQLPEKDVTVVMHEVFGSEDNDSDCLMRSKNETIFNLRRNQFEIKYPELMDEPFLDHFFDRCKSNILDHVWVTEGQIRPDWTNNGKYWWCKALPQHKRDSRHLI